MKPETRVILLGLLLGILMWYVDSVADYLFFYQGDFLALLVTDVPRHELYIRSLFLLCAFHFGLVVSRFIGRQRQTEARLTDLLRFQEALLNAIPLPVYYKDRDGRYLGCNHRFEEYTGLIRQALVGRTIFEILPYGSAFDDTAGDRALLAEPGHQQYEINIGQENGQTRHVIFNKATFLGSDGEVEGIVGALLDITDRKRAEEEREELIRELKAAIEKVRILRGMLPICASCKKIRDDQGYWNKLEAYIQRHSDAVFSHSICPECASRLYPELYPKGANTFDRPAAKG